METLVTVTAIVEEVSVTPFDLAPVAEPTWWETVVAFVQMITS